MCITLVGSLVIIIKKLMSRQIVKRIPKSNILPQQMITLHSTPRIIEVGHISETDTGML